MSPVEVANDAPDADAPRLCIASRRRKAVVSNCMGGGITVNGREAYPANAGSGRPGTSTVIAKMPPDKGSAASSSAARICRALVT